MDPQLDEKFILTASAAFISLAHDVLEVNGKREGHGPTINEGLCFDFCAGMDFMIEMHGSTAVTSGDHSSFTSGSIYIGMDGHTKKLMLPYIVQNIELDNSHPELAENALLSFSNQLGHFMATDLIDFVGEVVILPGKLMSNKLVEIPGAQYRKYMTVYFMQDDLRREYLGRVTMIIAIKK